MEKRFLWRRFDHNSSVHWDYYLEVTADDPSIARIVDKATGKIIKYLSPRYGLPPWYEFSEETLADGTWIEVDDFESWVEQIRKENRVATTYEDQLAKLGAKLDKYNADITEVTSKRDSVIEQINSIMTGTPASKTFGSTKIKGTIGDKIINSGLLPTTGTDVKTVAKQLKIPANKVALAFHHLIAAGRAKKDENTFYPVMVAAKEVSEAVTE